MQLNVGWLRSQIGVVSQEPTLFDQTIAENIAMGCPGATRQQIEDAARRANAYDFVMRLPLRFDTLVGSQGTQVRRGSTHGFGLDP